MSKQSQKPTRDDVQAAHANILAGILVAVQSLAITARARAIASGCRPEHFSRAADLVVADVRALNAAGEAAARQRPASTAPATGSAPAISPGRCPA